MYITFKFMNLRNIFISLLLISTLSGCIGGEKVSEQRTIQEGENTLSRISDMPFPEGTKVALNKSLLLSTPIILPSTL